MTLSRALVVVWLTGCASTHYGGGVSVGTDGHALKLGGDARFGVFANNWHQPEDQPGVLVMQGTNYLFGLGAGLEYDATRHELLVRYPGPEIEWMGTPAPLAPLVTLHYHQVARLYRGEDGPKSSLGGELRGGVGVARRLRHGPDWLTLMSAVPTLSVAFDYGGEVPVWWSLGLQVGVKRLDWSGLYDPRRDAPPPPEDLYGSPE